MSDTPTDRRDAMLAKLRASTARTQEQMALHRWRTTAMAVFVICVDALALYFGSRVGTIKWHLVATDTKTQLFLLAFAVNPLLIILHTVRSWMIWNRMQAAKRNSEQAALPPQEGVWPPPPTQP